MWKIVFSKGMYDELREFLFDTYPRENGCFLLANHYATRSGKNTVIVTGLVKPEAGSWNYSSEHSLGPSSSFINRSAVLADGKDASLMFVHTHPSSFHPPKFSEIDENSNERLFANLAEIIPDRPLGSLVLSSEGIYGVIFNRGKSEAISAFEVLGTVVSNLRNVDNLGSPRGIPSPFDRQVLLIGEAGQKRLQEMTATIVGVGGTGSAVAVQLARMGLRKLRLVDMDVIEKTNLARVYGSAPKDVGKGKVNVLKRHIATFSETDVEILNADITKRNVLPCLLDSDVIFGCTDNLASRAVLNDISIQYYIPLIDVGIRIHLNKDSTIDQAAVKVQLVTPDTACLWCTGTLDGKSILQESFPEENKRKLAEEGYYSGIEAQPSVISMTSMAASMSVNKFLDLIGVFGGKHDTRVQIEAKDGFMISDSPAVKSDCICHARRGVGDRRKIVN